MERQLRMLMIFMVLLLGLLPLQAEAQPNHRVRGYVTRGGVYVQPHRATNPDRSRFNNYSTRGNYNPYTGKTGTRHR
jgi:hypothetical protein